jgi:RimJ/RimL family protein N-acetyltransferase
MDTMPKSNTPSISLRNVIDSDLTIFFAHEQDPEANFMAAFTPKDPSNRVAFDAHWQKILADETITTKTILFEGQVAGNIARFIQSGEPEVCYWLGREFWGKGIASAALKTFLAENPAHPIFARVAKDNIASLRVLQKNRFRIAGEDKGFANARNTEIEEFILRLD